MPGGPIDQKVRKTIYAMIDAGASTKAIIEQTGASKTTINRIRAERTKDRTSPDDPPGPTPRTRTRDGSPTHATHADPPTHSAPLTAVEPVSTNLAFAGMCKLIDPLLDEFNACKSIEKTGEKAYAMSIYADKLIKIYSKIGSWTGLDDPAPIVVSESPLDEYLQKGLDMMKVKEATDAGSD